MTSIAFAPDGMAPLRGLWHRLMRRCGLGRARPGRIPLHIAIAGHVNGSYSLAAVNRGLAQAIERQRPGMVRLLPVEGAPTTDLSGVSADDTVRALIRRAPPPHGRRVVISHHYPVHVPQEPSDAAMALFYWEESLIPKETITVLNGNFAAILAPTRFVADALDRSGVAVPVHVVGQAPDLRAFRGLAVSRRRRGGDVVSFLHVSSCMARKGVDVLLAAYVRAFRVHDPVRLVIKGFPNPHNDVGARVARIRAGDPEAPEIVVINQDLSQTDLLALYRDADVMVLPTRGEGFNLPAAEAMAAGLGLIVTGHGGHMDFCSHTTARLLNFRLAPSQSHVAAEGSLWAEPDIADLVAALREATALDAPLWQARRAAARRRIDATMGEAECVRRIVAAAEACV